jgi:hypothetical protein
MSRGFGARAGVVALLALFLFMSLAPLAAADHSYSHRYVIFGRVVDANHNPVQGVTVSVGYDDVFAAKLEGACANQPDTETDAFGPTKTVPVTNSFGEFMMCFHHHDLSRGLPGKITLRIDEENYTRTFDADPYFRVTSSVETLDHVSPRANATADDTSYVIQGRLWRPAGKAVTVEGNPVFGFTLNKVPVNVTLQYDGITENFTTHTNNYGDFAYRANVTKRPTSGTVTIEAEGESHSYPIDGTNGVTALSVEMAKQSDPFLKGALLFGGGLVAVVVVGGAGWYGIRKVAARREEQAIRSRAVRKRSNK